MSKTLQIGKIDSGIETLKRLGHLSESFEILGHQITLRTILRKELESINRYCQPLYEEAQTSEDTFSLGNWIQAVKLETLAYAIMGIGNLDFTDIDYVATGDLDDATHKPIRVQKHAYVRSLLLEWEDSLVDTIFKKFQQLTEKAEARAKEGVVFQDQAHEARIAELEDELAQLKSELASVKSRPSADKEEPSSLDKNLLKKQMFDPVVPAATPQAQEDSEEEYVYAEDPPVKATKPKFEVDPYVDDVRYAEDEDIEPEVVYYNEKGEPLSEADMEVVREHERLAQRRREESQALLAKRKPLNQVDAKVTEKDSPQRQSFEDMPTVTANKKYEPSNLNDDVFVTQEEVLSPGERPDWGKAAVNPSAPMNQNPNFKPPHKK
jgi:hypothetical protein